MGRGKNNMGLILEGLNEKTVNEAVKPKKIPDSPRDEFSLRKKDEGVWTDKDTKKFKEFGASSSYCYVKAGPGEKPVGAEATIGKNFYRIRKLSNTAYIVSTFAVSNKDDTSKAKKREIWIF